MVVVDQIGSDSLYGLNHHTTEGLVEIVSVYLKDYSENGLHRLERTQIKDKNHQEMWSTVTIHCRVESQLLTTVKVRSIGTIAQVVYRW